MSTFINVDCSTYFKYSFRWFIVDPRPRRGAGNMMMILLSLLGRWNTKDQPINCITSTADLYHTWMTSGSTRINQNLQLSLCVYRVKIAYFDQVYWPLADLAQNLIGSSNHHGAPLCQVWWKSTQGFLRYRVYGVKIAYFDQVYWPLTLGGSRPKSNQFIYSSWCTLVLSLMKIHQGVLEISCLRGKNSIFRPSLLTFGGSHPKSNQFIYSSWCTPVPSLMKIHQGVLEISCLRGENSIFWPSLLTFDLRRISPKI